MNRINIIKVLSVLAFCVFVLFSFYDKEVNNPYQIGDKVENFSLPNIDGTEVQLYKDYQNTKGVIVIFTCNTCPYAIAYEDRIIALHEKYANMGYPVLAINPNDPVAQPGDSMEEMQIRAKEKGFSFPYVLDKGQGVYPQFGATKTPHVFLLNNEKGDLVVRYIGAIDDNHKDASQVKEPFLDNAIQALMNGREVVTKETKAIGCTIKTQ